MLIIIVGAMMFSAGVHADDSNEREGGGWSIEKYHGNGDDLVGKGVNANVDQFYKKMGQYGWSKTLRWKDDWAWESDFEDSTRGGYDYVEADSVDLVYFCGHGYQNGILFGTNRNTIKYNYAAANVEVKWGDQDMEWIVLDSCHVLQYKSSDGRYVWQRWDDPNGYPEHSALTIHAGLHVMIGWDSVAGDYWNWEHGAESRGGLFADKIHFYPHPSVWTAWNLATKQAKPWWDWHTYRAAMFYGKMYKGSTEKFRYSNEDFWNPWKDPTWYHNHYGWTIKYGYSSWNV